MKKSGGHAKAIPIPLACLWGRHYETREAMASRLGENADAACGRLPRMHDGGLDARYDKNKPGRPRKMDPKLHGPVSNAIDGQPEGCDIKSNAWADRLILIALSGAFGINGISPNAAYRTMRRAGKSYKKPGRPFDQRAPSDETKDGFEADQRRMITDAVAAGFGIFWVGGSLFSTKIIRGMARLTRGLSILRKIKPYGKICACFAALGVGGLPHHGHYDRGNTEYMAEFVKSIYEAYGWAIPIMDNASNHKSGGLMEELEKFCGAVMIVCLPTYSSDLNPVEMVWKELKKHTAGGAYKRAEDMAGATDEMFRTGTVILPPAPGYALDAAKRGMATARG